MRRVLLAAMSLNLGGAETHVVSLARELSRRGHKVVVASSGGCLVEELRPAGIAHYRVPLHSRAPWMLLSGIWGLGAVIRAEHVDVVHAHARIPAWAAEQVRRFRRFPLVATCHGVYSASLPLRLVSRWGDRVIAVSDDVQAHLVEKFGVPLDVIRVIPNGIDTGRFSPAGWPDRVREEFGIPAACPIVMHLSRLSGDFAATALALVEAAPGVVAELEDVRFIVAGDGERLAEVAEAARRVNERLEGEYVFVPGGRTDAPDLLRAADVVVGVARVALEAMATARPVVIAGEGGFRGVLDAGNTGSMMACNFTGRGSGRPVTAEELGAVLVELLRAPDRRRELGEVGRELVERFFSIERVADQVEAVYDEVC